MRKTIVSFTAVTFAIVVLVSTPLQKSSATETKKPAGSSVATQDQPGARCTRFSWPKGKKPADQTSTFAPGTRCARFWSTKRKGEFLPNAAPRLGLSSSTSYLGSGAPAEVSLDAIACDLDGDNLLYTYSATGGRINGEGSRAVWNLTGARPGTYTVSVEVDDGCGCVTFASGTVTVAN